MFDSKHEILKVINILQDAVDEVFERQISRGVFLRPLDLSDEMKPLPRKKIKVALSKSKAEQIVMFRYKQIKINLQRRSEPFKSCALQWAETAHYNSRLM